MTTSILRLASDARLDWARFARPVQPGAPYVVQTKLLATVVLPWPV
jgi:hypothetical protein